MAWERPVRIFGDDRPARRTPKPLASVDALLYRRRSDPCCLAGPLQASAWLARKPEASRWARVERRSSNEPGDDGNRRSASPVYTGPPVAGRPLGEARSAVALLIGRPFGAGRAKRSSRSRIASSELFTRCPYTLSICSTNVPILRASTRATASCGGPGVRRPERGRGEDCRAGAGAPRERRDAAGAECARAKPWIAPELARWPQPAWPLRGISRKAFELVPEPLQRLARLVDQRFQLRPPRPGPAPGREQLRPRDAVATARAPPSETDPLDRT